MNQQFKEESQGVLSVAQIDHIKKLREMEGWSINKIAVTLKHSWATVEKYADHPVDLQSRGKRNRIAPVLGPFQDTINAWLAEDERRARKQRRTAQKIFRDLQALGYTGSDRTVRHDVCQRRLEMKAAANEQFIRLEHPPGTAQVDFGEFRAIVSSESLPWTGDAARLLSSWLRPGPAGDFSPRGRNRVHRVEERKCAMDEQCCTEWFAADMRMVICGLFGWGWRLVFIRFVDQSTVQQDGKFGHARTCMARV